MRYRPLVKYAATLCCAGLVLAADARAQDPQGLPTSQPEAVGMSTGRLQRLDQVMQGYIDRGEVAGTVTLVARRGRVVHFDARGTLNLEDGRPMPRDAIFRLASMTKPIVSVALMMLYEEGHFQLQDHISAWLPEFAEMEVAIPQPDGDGYRTVPAENAITVQQVLTHTAGFANVFGGATQSDAVALQNSVRPGATIGDMVTRLAGIPLNFEPGERWEYGPGTDVVGRLVEVMSGQPLDEFLEEHIFGPLDMPDTHFYLPEAKLHRFSPQYTPAGRGRLDVTDTADEASRWVAEPHVYFSGAGNPGLVSTARDYFRFQQMMLNGGELDGVRILGRKTIELMTANHTGDFPLWLAGPGNGFGLGYAVVTDLGQSGYPKSVGTFWWGGGSGPVFWVDPVEELIGILMVQIRPFDHINIRDDIASVTYQAIVD